MRFGLLLVLISAGLGLSTPATLAAAAQRDEQVRRQLDMATGVSWRGLPLREALERLVEDRPLAVLLDRRIDPDQRVDYSSSNLPLEQLFRELAAEHEAAVSIIGPVVYVGPPETAARLRTLVQRHEQQVERLPAEWRSRLLARRSWGWPRLATPRELLERLAGEAGVVLDGIEDVPHDLWPQAGWPELNWVERMSLVLAGFHRTIELDGPQPATAGFNPSRPLTVRLVPIPESVAIERTFRTTSAAAERRVLELVGREPGASVRRQPSGLVVAGTWELHQAIDDLLRQGASTSAAPPRGQTRYRLRVENAPAGAVLREIAARAELELQQAERLAEQLEQLVSFEVEDATLDELLEAVLEPVGLSFERRGRLLHIR